jgi:hypothetical protein
MSPTGGVHLTARERRERRGTDWAVGLGKESNMAGPVGPHGKGRKRKRLARLGLAGGRKKERGGREGNGPAQKRKRGRKRNAF